MFHMARFSNSKTFVTKTGHTPILLLRSRNDYYIQATEVCHSACHQTKSFSVWSRKERRHFHDVIDVYLWASCNASLIRQLTRLSDAAWCRWYDDDDDEYVISKQRASFNNLMNCCHYDAATGSIPNRTFEPKTKKIHKNVRFLHTSEI